MNKPPQILFENDLIRLQQIRELLEKKQSILSDQNQKIQSLFEDADNLDDKVVETEEYDDNFCQHVDFVDRFVQKKENKKLNTAWTPRCLLEVPAYRQTWRPGNSETRTA